MTPALYQHQMWAERRVGEPVTAVIARPAPAADYTQDTRRLPGGFFDDRPDAFAGCRVLSHSIATRLCSLAGDRRVGGYDLPATRPVVKFVRAVMAARRLCVPEHFDCQVSYRSERHIDRLSSVHALNNRDRDRKEFVGVRISFQGDRIVF